MDRLRFSISYPRWPIQEVMTFGFIKKFLKKSNVWPQHSPTEKVLKFSMIFHDSTKKIFFQNIKKAKFNTLNDSEVLNRDFPGLKTSATSATSLASTASMASMTSTASIHQKKILILLVRSSLALKWSKPITFWRMDHQNFYWYLTSFLSEAVEANQYYFFENWLVKTRV